jgi:hypothetical protein
MCKSVLFPAPDWPTIATSSPGAIVKSSPWKRVSAPRAVRYVFSRLQIWMMGEFSCAREFDSRMKRKAGLAAAGVIRSIRYYYLIAKSELEIIAKVTSVHIAVTIFCGVRIKTGARPTNCEINNLNSPVTACRCHRSQSSIFKLCRNMCMPVRTHGFCTIVITHGLCTILMLMAFAVFTSADICAQGSFSEHNSAMASLQPTFVTPLVAPDPRLIQYARFSVSHGFTPSGAETVNYGNGRGAGVIAGRRFEFDFVPPPYIQHNGSAEDGFGDTSVVVKYRIASGNAEHGGFDVAAVLGHCFATGSKKNGATTDSFGPTITAGLAFRRRFDVITSLGGTLPTGKIYSQGRSVIWNSLAQAHLTPHIWFEVENNSTFYFGGSHDGKMQNFVTPAAFYVLRPKSWKPAHPFYIIDGGMQIATSGFHTCNHNLITEVRVLF